jgi:hypothetical protein
MSRGPDAATQFSRALEQSGPGVIVARHDSTPWASVTFAGARHRLTIEAPLTPGFDRWLAALPEAEFALRGHLVADLTIGSIERCGGRVTVAIDVLTVED